MRYRKLAKQMHPDKNGGTEEAKKRLFSEQNMFGKLGCVFSL